MNRSRDTGHRFALFYVGISQLNLIVGDNFIIDDADLVRRISRVLRLHPHDSLLLFDQYAHFCVEIVKIGKKKVVAFVKSVNQNVIISPRIVAWLPLLKKDAFEQAIYSLVELGINEIQLVKTAKEQRHWYGEKELNRLHHIMIAAAEQSKNFAFPVVKEPRLLSELLLSLKQEKRLFFDAQGKPLLEVANMLVRQKNDDYVVLVGPEGDLTDSEKSELRANGFLFIRLTPTVLRARQAVVVGLGSLRSML